MAGKNKYIQGIGVFLLIVTGCILAFGYGRRKCEWERRSWEKEVGRLIEKSRKAVIIQRVSEQMEEMAYQQKEISDQRWQEAVHQKKIAERLQLLAETETAKALQARSEALEASLLAREQKKIADEQREEALKARLVADTLAGLALGRSLGTFAIGQYQTGHQELARLLGYHAWKYTSENRGDCYQPAILGALTLVSESQVACYRHEGEIRGVVGIKQRDGQAEWVSVNEAGEVVMWGMESGEWKGTEICSMPDLDFRKVVWDRNSEVIYAAAWSGVLVAFKGNQFCETEVWDSGQIGVCDLVLLDGEPYLFYKDGSVWCRNKDKMKGNFFIDRLVELRKDKSLIAVALDCPGKRYAAGYEDGRIILYRDGRQKVLTGHVSAVTDLVFGENRLVSVSYDGRLNLWDLQVDNPEPVVVTTYQDWLYAVDQMGELVACGGRTGTLYINSVSPDEIAEKLKGMLTRDFTAEERFYYLNEQKGGME